MSKGKKKGAVVYVILAIILVIALLLIILALLPKPQNYKGTNPLIKRNNPIIPKITAILPKVITNMFVFENLPFIIIFSSIFTNPP